MVGEHWWRVSVVSVRCGCVPRLRCRALLACFRFCFAWRVLLALLARVRTCGVEEHDDDMVRTKTSTHQPAKQSEDDRKHRSRHPAAGATPHLLRIRNGVFKLLPQRAGHRLRDTVLGQPYLRQVRLQSSAVAQHRHQCRACSLLAFADALEKHIRCTQLLAPHFGNVPARALALVAYHRLVQVDVNMRPVAQHHVPQPVRPAAPHRHLVTCAEELATFEMQVLLSASLFPVMCMLKAQDDCLVAQIC